MEKFIENLEATIYNNCKNNSPISFLKNISGLKKENLLFGFGLLRLLDLGLKYSKKNSRIVPSGEMNSPFLKEVTVVNEEQDLDDKTVYINDIFSLTELYYFDAGIMNIFNMRPSSIFETVFPNDVSFAYESRLEILSRIIGANNNHYDYILKRYPKDKLRDSKEMQNDYMSSLPLAFVKEEDVYEFLKHYISCFVEPVRSLFDSIRFLDHLPLLNENFLSSDLIIDLANIDFPKENFSSRERFLEILESFIITFSEKYHVGNEQDYLRELLVDFLFTDTNLEDYSQVRVYDPFYFSMDTLSKSEEHILNVNSACDVKLYGKIDFWDYNYVRAKHRICARKDKLIFNAIFNSILLDNRFLSTQRIEGVPFEDVSLEDFDFIVSDCRCRDVYDDAGFIRYFQDKLDNPSKLVAIIDKRYFNNKSINWMIKNDNLEAIICFKDYFILIANSNKSLKRRDKFILIDYDILSNYEWPHVGEPLISTKENKELERFVKEMAKKPMLDEILRIYKEFIDTPFSKVIDNVEVIKDYDYDEIDKYWGTIYERGRNIPKDIEEKSKKYHESINIDEKYIKDFYYNDLMYDKIKKPSLILRQKAIGNNKSQVIEEKVGYVPLHSIITFDSNEIDEDKVFEREIRKYKQTFYITSEKFLKKFVMYYLDSEPGIEDFNYFSHDLLDWNSFERDYYRRFIYIRIPVVNIEVQEKIIEAYELNEEHYNLVKQSRDNFMKNILDYEKVLKDMEEFNKMEIDTKTGQIVKMSTVKRHMFDGLLWPLSISYLNAVHGTHVSNPNEKLDFYLKLFEFLTAFIDIVLISSIPDEEYSDLKEDLWEGISGNYTYKAAFGTWTTLYHKLLDLYADKGIEPKFNNKLIDSLLDQEIYEIMDEARDIRNEFPGHGTSIHESRAKQLIDDLKSKIDVVYDIFGYLTGFKLFYSVKVLELLDDGTNLYEVVSLNGPCDQPIYGKVTFNKRLKNNSLYLNNSMDGDLLELNPNLIKFEEVIEEYTNRRGQKKQRATGRFYLYLFNGFKKKNNKYQVRYKCYQIETDEIRKNISLDEWDELM